MQYSIKQSKVKRFNKRQKYKEQKRCETSVQEIVFVRNQTLVWWSTRKRNEFSKAESLLLKYVLQLNPVQCVRLTAAAEVNGLTLKREIDSLLELELELEVNGSTSKRGIDSLLEFSTRPGRPRLRPFVPAVHCQIYLKGAFWVGAFFDRPVKGRVASSWDI